MKYAGANHIRPLNYNLTFHTQLLDIINGEEERRNIYSYKFNKNKKLNI